MKKYLALATVLTIACVQTLQAAFIVEPIAGGKAFANYAWVGGAGGVASTTGLGGTAPGLSGIPSSIYGGNVSPDIYQFSYTPGIDVDNTPFAAGLLLGDNYGAPNLASGVVGGGSGMYNVYATWIVSSNVNAAGVDFAVTSDAAPVNVLAVNQNTGMSGSPGGNAGWFLLAANVPLTSGLTYTVTMDAVADTFVSMRSAGVMWEAAPIPEPSILALSILGGAVLFGLISRRKNR